MSHVMSKHALVLLFVFSYQSDKHRHIQRQKPENLILFGMRSMNARAKVIVPFSDPARTEPENKIHSLMHRNKILS